jgi:hypothetical protein
MPPARLPTIRLRQRAPIRFVLCVVVDLLLFRIAAHTVCIKASLKRKRSVSLNAVNAVSGLKQNIGFLQKVLVCVTGSKVDYSGVLEAHRRCTGEARRALDGSLALAVFMTRRCVMEVCKHGQFAQLSTLICKAESKFGVDSLTDQVGQGR